MPPHNSIHTPPRSHTISPSEQTVNQVNHGVFGSALLRIFSPLVQLVKLLLSGFPGSMTQSLKLLTAQARNAPAAVRNTHKKDEITETNENEADYFSACSETSYIEELERSSSGESVSTADAIGFKLLHYQAALEVVNEILKQNSKPDANISLEEFSSLIDRAASALREKQSQNISFDNTSIKQGIGGKHKRSKMTDVFRQFKREQTALVHAGTWGRDIPESTRHVHVRTALASVIHGKFRSLGFRTKSMSIDALDKQIFERYIDVLQSKDWNNISVLHDLRFTEPQCKFKNLKFLTTMTPAKNLDSALTESYRRDGINGVCSYAIQEARHAVNLWRTKFRPYPISDTDTAYVFSGLRHAVHDAYGIKIPDQRNAANDARVKEFIHASLLDHLKRNKLDARNMNSEEVIEINIVSVNLLTAAGKEKEMIEQQQRAFARANGQEMRIRIADGRGHEKELKVKPSIFTFCTPVNHLSLSKMGRLIGIWRTADSINKKSVKHLIGSIEKNKPIGGLAGDQLRKLNAELANTDGASPAQISKRKVLTEKISLIKELVNQVREIMLKDLHHEVGNEPYKLPTRLLALSNEIGATPAFNCKSGKDRTGQLHVEIRDLYAHLNATGGLLREINAKRQGIAQENFQKLFFAGGDREIQALNTGVAGSKSQLPYYNKLMGVTPQTIDEIKGLSKWVGT